MTCTCAQIHLYAFAIELVFNQPTNQFLFTFSLNQWNSPRQRKQCTAYYTKFTIYIAAFICLLLLLLIFFRIPLLLHPSKLVTMICDDRQQPSVHYITRHTHMYIVMATIVTFRFIWWISVNECVVWRVSVYAKLMFFMLVSRPINFPVTESSNWRLFSHFTLSCLILVFCFVFSAIFFSVDLIN